MSVESELRAIGVESSRLQGIAEAKVRDAEWLAGEHFSKAPVKHHGDWFVVTALTVVSHFHNYWEALHASRNWWENGIEYNNPEAE